MTAAGADNVNANPNNIIFTIKDKKLYVPVVTLSSRDSKKLSKLLRKDFKDQFTGMNIKQKGRIKIQQMNIDIHIFSNQVWCFSLFKRRWQC